MKQRMRKVLLVFFLAVFAVSGGVFVHELLQYQEGERVYSEAAELVDLPELADLPQPTAPTPVEPGDEAPDQEGEAGAAKPAYVDPYADALRNMDFTALQEVNDDVLGWVLIPWTKISYPVVQGDDNDYYLRHTWRKTSGSVGAIFMDVRCSQDLSGFNTILYGHRMNNGSMFAGLKYYKQAGYRAQHPVVYLTTARGSFQYEIFSVYEGSPTGESYRTSFSSPEKKQAFLDAAVEASLYDTGVTPTVDDSVLTLSTCTGNGHAKRLIVHAMRKGYAASDTAQAEESAGEAQPGEAPAEAEPDAQAAAPAEAQTPAEAPAQAPEGASGETEAQPPEQTPQEALEPAEPGGGDAAPDGEADPGGA